MAVRAIEAEIVGDDAHGAEKIVDSEFFQCARRDVLKEGTCLDVRRWRRHLRLRRGFRDKGRSHPEYCRCSDCKRQSRPPFHRNSSERLRMKLKKGTASKSAVP